MTSNKLPMLKTLMAAGILLAGFWVAAPKAQAAGLEVSVKTPAGGQQTTISWKVPADIGDYQDFRVYWRPDDQTPWVPKEGENWKRVSKGISETTIPAQVGNENGYKVTVQAVTNSGQTLVAETRTNVDSTGNDSTGPPSTTTAAAVKTEFGVTPGPQGIKELGEKIYDWALPIGLSITILMLIYAGYVFITSAGSPERVTEAKTIAVYAISGVVLLVLLGVVYQAITGNPFGPFKSPT